jgi:hypothetical protein
MEEARSTAAEFHKVAEDFPDGPDQAADRRRQYWANYCRFWNLEDSERFFGAMREAGIPI